MDTANTTLDAATQTISAAGLWSSKDPLVPGQTGYIDPTTIDEFVSTLPNTDEQNKLKALIKRRHPEYKELELHWEFLEETYEGGRDWFTKNIFRYIKEGNQEYADRLERCYRFNHTREVVDLINKYLFKQNIVRNEEDAPDSVVAFWKKSTRNGLDINNFARQISKKTSIYGRVGIVVDSTRPSTKIISRADEKSAGLETYAYIVTPQNMLDYSFDDSGELQWILIREYERDDKDPFKSSGDQSFRYRLWTKTEWKLYKEVKNKRLVKIELVDSGKHDLGVVPVILADNIISDELYESQSMIDDIAYLDRAVANYLSNLDAIVQDQTYSQLAMPAQNVLPGEDNYTKLVEMGTKRVFLYDGESGGEPHFLSPDIKQANLIVDVVNKIIAEIYHTVGLAGERTKQDNAVGIDNSSGVAKAYDFERVNALLAAKADSLEAIENKIVGLVALWRGQENAVDGKKFVSYPDNFDTRSLRDEFDIATKLMLVEAPETVRQEQMSMLVDKLFPQLAKRLRDKMDADIKDWPMDPIELATQLQEINGAERDKLTVQQNNQSPKPPQTKPVSENRQGQVTSKSSSKKSS